MLTIKLSSRGGYILDLKRPCSWFFCNHTATHLTARWDLVLWALLAHRSLCRAHPSFESWETPVFGAILGTSQVQSGIIQSHCITGIVFEKNKYRYILGSTSRFNWDSALNITYIKNRAVHIQFHRPLHGAVGSFRDLSVCTKIQIVLLCRNEKMARLSILSVSSQDCAHLQDA